MITELLTPDYIFEASWEVCNKVGGIYTVLSTRAKTLGKSYGDKLIFIGPDLWQGKENPLFTQIEELYAAWRKYAKEEQQLNIRIGRWNIPGNPVAMLIDFQPFFDVKNEIYAKAWEIYQIDSLHAYGDYDEASMFSYAAGKVVESFYRYYLTDEQQVVYQAHEWMTGLGALYLQKAVPQIATIFTTHATSIGRSIAGNNKPLYDYLFAYNGDQMAQELNVRSKHSIEKQTARHVDCFTTVSEITNEECKELLDKPADVILMNGFENDFVPKGKTFVSKRQKARVAMLEVANKLLGTQWNEETIIVSTSGRYEFKNKGIDMFLESLKRLSQDPLLEKNVLAFIYVPGWVGKIREDLTARLNSAETFITPLETPFVTHWLHNMDNDRVLNMLKYLGMENKAEDKVKVVFVPCYLNGKDGIFNLSYYDLILGNDLCVYPSYYEPWGYTPLESAAFQIPTITTDLAGFGLWVNSIEGHPGTLEEGIKVVHRSDNNYSEAAEEIKNALIAYASLAGNEREKVGRNAGKIAQKALWKNFIRYYYQAYDVAMRNAQKRLIE